MSDQQKIWFIYLTDHHEGPFTPDEVAEKISQGAVTAQSLGWKDGMPEWLAIESIPELSAALNSPASSPQMDAAPAAGGEEGFSLAQMLASQQSGGGDAPAASESLPSSSPSSESLLVDSSEFAAESASLIASSEAPVEPSDVVWTMRVGEQVSGLFSLQQLKGMASQGDVPQNAMLWHSGWTDFQPLSAVPEVASARQAKKAAPGASLNRSGATNTNIQRPRAFAPITAAADLGSDDPTDPGLSRPRGAGGFMDKVKAIFARKPKAAKATGKIGGARRSNGMMDSVKRLAPILGGLLVVGLGAAVYLLFFSSPIPSDLDVIAEDIEVMKEVVKAPAEEGPRLHLALARGTEDNPADDTAPKFYVATNLPEGTAVTISISGHPGTLVNKPSLEKSYTSTVGDNHLAVFESLQDDGKPLPMGEYTMKVTAEGVEPLVMDRFLGGRKSGVYTSRLTKYKDKLQGDYDKEMQTLREFIDTLKSLQTEVSRHLREYNTNWQNPSNRTRITNEWRNFASSSQAMVTQIDQRIKEASSGATPPFHPRTFQDISTTLAQILQLMQLHSERLSGRPPQTNPNDLDGLVQAGVISLEQWLAQAIVKNPFDVLNAKPGAEVPANPEATPPATPAPPAPANQAAPAP